MKPSRLLGWSLLLIAAVLGAGWYGAPRLLWGPMVAAEAVVRADFVQSVVASGHVEAPFRVNIGSQITGIVADVPVVEGQTVLAGAALVLLDDHEARAGVVQAEGAVAQAAARVRQIAELTLPAAQATVAQARATALSAEQDYARARVLARDGYGTRQALDQATMTRDVAQAQLRNAELLVYTNSPGGSDAVMAQTQLAQAQAALATAQARLSYTVVRAPRDGVLIARSVDGRIVAGG